MKSITLLQQSCLVVGNSVVFANVLQAFWNSRTIKVASFSISLAGLILSVSALAVAIIGIMLTFASRSPYFQNKETSNRLYSWLKDGFVLGTISGTGIYLI